MNAPITKEEVREVVEVAVRSALRGANMIDGPTHIAHHQAITEALAMTRHAKKTAISVLVKGLCGALFLGILAWVWGNRVQ